LRKYQRPKRGPQPDRFRLCKDGVFDSLHGQCFTQSAIEPL
jgi:hypothetical protein